MKPLEALDKAVDKILAYQPEKARKKLEKVRKRLKIKKKSDKNKITESH